MSVKKDNVKGVFVVESGGCPDHDNMKGGSGTAVKNPQGEMVGEGETEKPAW